MIVGSRLLTAFTADCVSGKALESPPFGPKPESRSGATTTYPIAAMSSAIDRAQSVSPKISWIISTTGALWLTSGYTTNAFTVRLPYLIFTHSWCRGDLFNIAFAQSWLCAAVEVKAKASAAQSATGMNQRKGERVFMREVYYIAATLPMRERGRRNRSRELR